MIGNFDVTIDELNNIFFFTNISEKVAVKSLIEAIDILSNFTKIIDNNAKCVADQDSTYEFSSRNVINVIKIKTDEVIKELTRLRLLEKTDLKDQALKITTLCNQIYEFTVTRIGIRSLDINIVGNFLNFLNLRQSSRLIRTSKDFYKTLNPIFKKKFAIQKHMFRKNLIEKQKTNFVNQQQFIEMLFEQETTERWLLNLEY